MLRKLFGSSDAPQKGTRPAIFGPKIPRHSSGWGSLIQHLRTTAGLRVLDIGPTSPGNINFLTEMGHSVYMADLVAEAASETWIKSAGEEGAEREYDVEGFLEHNLDFSGREFDVVLFWDVADYLPEPLVAPIVGRIHSVMRPGGLLLGFFHTRETGPETIFCRYHVTAEAIVDMQEGSGHPLRRIYNNRKIEKLFTAFSGKKFFLAKDATAEVIITR